ncbi:MAG: dipeptidase [bacterium]|nr:dipeptidase [bacterium]
MIKYRIIRTICPAVMCAVFFVSFQLYSCSMVLVGKNATADGSVLLAHNNDLPGNIASKIIIVPGKNRPPGSVITFKNGLEIPGAAETYRMLMMCCYYGFGEGDAVAVNQYQVAIAGGVALKGDRNHDAQHADPLNPKGISGHIRYIALQRSKTARECVQLIGDMYSKYGISYPSGVGVADANEVWYLEAGGGKCWAAARVPDNSYLAVTNGYRIGTIDFNDHDNFIYPLYLKDFTIKKGLWKPEKKEFNFARIFGGRKEKEQDYYNARRIWRMQQILTPSRRQNPNDFDFPLMLKPDKKLTVPMLIAILRDRCQGTPYAVDTSQGCGISSRKGAHVRQGDGDVSPHKNTANTGDAAKPVKKERVVGVLNTVHSDVICLRSELPAEIGAVMWAAVGAAPSSPYVPYYLGISEISDVYGNAGPAYDPQSAFWIFRSLTTLLEPRFSTVGNYVLSQLRAMEKQEFDLQPEVEKTALRLYKKDKVKALGFLTIYSNGLSLQALQKAKILKRELETKLAQASETF